MIVANFNRGTTTKGAFGIYQYNYGQVLRIQGLTLPPAVEVHFSLQNTGGEATTRIGVTKDGVTDVVIPDSFLENGDIAQNVIRQIKRCLFRQIKTGLSEHLTMG